MATEFKLPELGEGIDEADVSDVLVSIGDVISKDQPVIEAETDKAAVEIPSDVAGKVVSINVGKGDTVKVGQVVLTLDAADNGEPAKPEKKAKPKKAEAPKPEAPAAADSGASVDFKLPELGEGIDEADVAGVLVSVGDVIAKGDPVIEAETDKAAVEIPSDVGGKITNIAVSKGDTVKVGQVIATIESTGDAPAPAKPAAPKPAAEAPAKTETAPPPAPPAEAPKPSAPAKPAGKGPVPASPSTRQFAREIGIDIHLVPGTGPGGRISVDDIKKFAREYFASGGGMKAAPADESGEPQLPRVVREPMSKVRKVTAAHMEKCWQSPHVTIHDKADVTDLEALRKKFKPRAQKAGGSLTITPIFAKIIAAALKTHPNLNASLDMTTNEVEFHNYYNVGIAVDTPRGLVVPVLRDVDQKSIIDLAVELTEIGVKARDGKLTIDDMRGATFTITNLGSIGIGFFTPIVNNPEVAILGMGRAKMEPVWNESENGFEPRLMAPLSLSFDHRLVDGADGARFLRWIVEAINSPLLLSLE